MRMDRDRRIVAKTHRSAHRHSHRDGALPCSPNKEDYPKPRLSAKVPAQAQPPETARPRRYPPSKPCVENFNVRLFSVTVRTTF